MHAINSLITCTELYTRIESWPHQNLLIFSYNSAQRGGGLYMESAAQLRVRMVKNSNQERFIGNLRPSISFISNSAPYGEAIYVADKSYFDVCDGEHPTVITTAAISHAQCFFQVFSNASYLVANTNTTNIEFNSPGIPVTSTVIFGGLLDRCTPDPRAESLTNSSENVEIDGFTYLKFISNINDTKQISSLPVRVCFLHIMGNQTVTVVISHQLFI